MADRNITLSLNVRPDMSPAQAALRSMAADLGRAAQSTDHLRAGLKMPAGTVAPTVDQAQAAVEQLNAASAARQQTLATALEAMDPARIKELTTQTLGLEVAHKRLTEALQVEREAQTGLSVAQEQVNAGLEGMQRSIDLANAALEPDALKRRIALTLELRKAQGELADAIAREEGGFLGVLGAKVGGRLGQILTLAGKAIKAVSGLGEATAPTPPTETAKPVEVLPASAPTTAAGAEALPEVLPAESGLEGLATAAESAAASIEGLDAAAKESETPKTREASGPRESLPSRPAPKGGGFEELTGGGEAEAGGGLEAAGGIEAAGAGEAAAGLGGLAAATGPAAIAIIALGVGAAIAEKAFEKAVQLANVANPASVEQFNMALADIQGVIGQRLVPVVELATEIARDWGDVIANMLPSTQDVRNLLDELRPSIDEVKEAMLEAAPVVKELAKDGLKAMALTLKTVVQGARPFLDALVQAAHGLQLLFFGEDRGPGTATARGAAAGPAKIQGLEDLSNDIITSAFRVGRPEAEDPQKQLTGGILALTIAVDNARKFLEDTFGQGKAALKGAKEGLDVAADTGRKALDFFNNPFAPWVNGF